MFVNFVRGEKIVRQNRILNFNWMYFAGGFVISLIACQID